MVNIEKFVYKNARISRENLPEITLQKIDPRFVIGCRESLTKDRFFYPTRRRGSREYPDIIIYQNNMYCIDGHHKIRRAIDNNVSMILARVLVTDNSLLGESLEKIRSSYIHELEIR